MEDCRTCRIQAMVREMRGGTKVCVRHRAKITYKSSASQPDAKFRAPVVDQAVRQNTYEMIRHMTFAAQGGDLYSGHAVR